MLFPKFTHHICFVSDQILPNYFGVTLGGSEPNKIHLVVTKKMREKVKILELALKHRNKKYEIKQYFLEDESVPNNISDLLDKIYEQCVGESIAVNLTGGTKIMTVTAMLWASCQDTPPFLYYVDTDNQKILQISGKQETFPLNKKIGVKEHLEAGSGYPVSSFDSNPPAEYALPPEELMLINFVDHDTNSAQKRAIEQLGIFNKFADTAEKAKSLSVPLPDSCHKILQGALDIAQNAGKLQINDKTIIYTSPEARSWCKGGWLEEFVRLKLYKMNRSGILDDWAVNIVLKGKGQTKPSSPGVKLSWAKGDLNELDAAFTRKNKLYLIECKTKNLAKDNSQTIEKNIGFADTIYKLHSLKESLGGVLSSGMIVSMYPPGIYDLERCNYLKLKAVFGKDILQLEKKLQEWINPSQK